MIYKQLGKTGLKVSVVGFGGIPVQRTDKDGAKEAIIKSEQLGINYIDTARGYTVSEEFIGYALEGRRKNWIIATKSMCRDFDSMEKDIQISLNNLRTDYIDLYQVHNIKDMQQYEAIFSENGAYKALLKAKEEGKIGHIGATFHSLEVLKVAIESGKFETVMYPYNIVENQAEDLFKRAKELDIGVIVMKPLAGGAITDGALALKYILNNENVSTVIPGMADLKEVEENATAGNDIKPLNDEEINKINGIKKQLGSEFCRRCGYCAPCTKGIDIPSVFLFAGYKERYNLEGWAEDRYNTLKATAKDCIKCGACEKRCPYNLPIIKMMEKAKVTFGR